MGAGRHEGLPVGVVTLLFSDIEGSTRLLQTLGEAYGRVLGDHHRLLREVWLVHDGVEVDTEGDAFFVAFADPGQAVRAAVSAQRSLGAHEWPDGGDLRVRMGVHTGSPRVRDGNYWGIDVHYAARLCAAAHGGQVLVSESTAGLVDIALENLGEHALRDFPAARRIFHLPIDERGKDFFPAPRTLQTGQTNLPDQLSSFVGREAELERLCELAARERLVTLTGPGGVGKTRLALRLGAELLDGSGDGVWFVDLAPLSDGALVVFRTAEVLGVTARAGQEVLDALGERLSPRRLLLVLDNCEHVVEAAASLVGELLGRCPGVFVLATSREPLGIAGEHVYRVPALSVPPSEEVDELGALAGSEAVQLFVARAAQQRPGFALDSDNASAVAGVCRRLDGIPLAIELAAVRMRSMSIDDLNARLDHRLTLLRGASRTALPRQQTLLALLEWSYRLLSEPERLMLARLAVFPSGGFDLAAVEDVCGDASGAEYGALDHLDALVDKSLVQIEDSAGVSRYRLLETIREYASAKLDESGQQEATVARRAHRDHYLALAETAEPNLVGADRLVWLDRLSAEQDNLRVALAECLLDPDADPGLRLAAALVQFWGPRGHAVEGARALVRQLERPEARDPTPARGRALGALSHLLSNWLGDPGPALAYAEEALAIARRSQDDHLVALALQRLAWAHLVKGEFSRALALSEEGLTIARSLEDRHLLAAHLTGRGAAVSSLGGDGRADLEKALDLAHEIGNPNLTATYLQNLGYMELTAGDPSAARARLREALAIHRKLGQATEVTFVSNNLGFAEHAAGDQTSAAQLFSEALTDADRDGSLGLLGSGLLGAALTRAEPTTAAKLHGAADAILEPLGYALDEFVSGLRDADHNRRRTQLGDDGFATAYNAGRRQRREDAIALAVSSTPTGSSSLGG